MNGQLNSPLNQTTFLGVDQISSGHSWLSTIVSGTNERPIVSQIEPKMIVGIPLLLEF